MNTKLNLSGLWPDFGTLGTYPDTPEQLSAFFVAVLLLVFAIFIVISIGALHKSQQRIGWLKKLLVNETSQTVVKSRQNLIEQANMAQHEAGHLWKEFDETLIEAEIGDNIHLHNIYDSSHFFNSSSLAEGITESRMLAAVPGFLTALGVIGTFVGLQLGLSELNIGNNVEIKVMKEGLAHVIGGAKIAFMSSVWGVSLSVIFNVFEKWLERKARINLHKLQTRIDELFPRFSAESQLQRIANDGAQSRESLQGLAEHIGQKLQESLLEATTGIQKGLEASLEKIMGPAINKLVDETTDGNQKALENLVESFLDRFGEQGESQRQAMDTASQGVGDALSTMNTTLDGFVRHLEQNQTAASEREVKLTETISIQVDGLVSQNKEHERMLTEFVETQFSGITKNIEQSRHTQEEREKHLSESFQHAINGVEQNMQKHTSATSELIVQGKGLQQQVETSLTNYKSIAEHVQLGAMELQDAAKQLREYGDGVRQSSQQLGGVIKDAANTTADLAEENRKTSSAVGQVYQKLSADIEKLQTIVSNLGSVVETADSTFNHLEEHQQSYLGALKANVTSLAEQMTQLLSDYAEQANAQTASHLNLWAEHTTNYAQQMNSAAQALSSVVDEIEVKLGS